MAGETTRYDVHVFNQATKRRGERRGRSLWRQLMSLFGINVVIDLTFEILLNHFSAYKLSGL